MKIFEIAVKEFKIIFRESAGLLFMFMMPVTLLIVFNIVLGGAFNTSLEDRPFKLPVINLDQGELGNRVVQEMKNFPWIIVESKDDKGIDFSATSIKETVSKGERSQALIIPADFTEKINNDESFEIDFIVDPGAPIQFVGPVEGMISGAIGIVLFQEKLEKIIPEQINNSLKMMEESFGLELPPALKDKMAGENAYKLFIKDKIDINYFSENLPVSLKRIQPERIRQDKFPTVYQQNLSGYSIMSIFFIVTSIGTAFFKEKDLGTFRRILAAPVSKATYLAGHLIPYVIINLLQVLVLILLSLFAFGTTMGSSPLAFWVTIFCTSIAANGFGLLMVTLFNNHQRMESVSVVLVLITTALSGAFVPRFVMGETVQKFSLIVPQSWAMEALQNVMVRSHGLLDVLPYCGVILGFAAIFFIFALIRFRFE